MKKSIVFSICLFSFMLDTKKELTPAPVRNIAVYEGDRILFPGKIGEELFWNQACQASPVLFPLMKDFCQNA